MKTKYGDITADQYARYKKSLVDRIYAILPMKEEGIDTISEYIASLNTELVKNLSIFGKCEQILTVVCHLENIISESDHKIYRKEILHCCNLISRIGDDNV